MNVLFLSSNLSASLHPQMSDEAYLTALLNLHAGQMLERLGVPVASATITHPFECELQSIHEKRQYHLNCRVGVAEGKIATEALFETSDWDFTFSHSYFTNTP